MKDISGLSRAPQATTGSTELITAVRTDTTPSMLPLSRHWRQNMLHYLLGGLPTDRGAVLAHPHHRATTYIYIYTFKLRGGGTLKTGVNAALMTSWIRDERTEAELTPPRARRMKKKEKKKKRAGYESFFLSSYVITALLPVHLSRPGRERPSSIARSAKRPVCLWVTQSAHQST